MNPEENVYELPVQPLLPPNEVAAASESKLSDVSTFNGNPKNPFQFLSQLNVFFLLQPNRFNTDLSKCYYSGLRCEDYAANCFNPVSIGSDADDILSN
jgi:hypothetical protein